MKKTLCFSILLTAAVLLFASSRTFSGELQFLWSNYLDSGVVFDMEFMPDNNYFIMGTYYCTQIRETATGNVVQTYPFYLSHIEFTPDSTKMITQHEYNIQLRNINDLSVIKQYTLPWGTDTTDLNYELSSIGWDNIIVDPIRPLCYGLRVRSGIISNNGRVNINRVMIYNYETMTEVGELTVPDDIKLGIKIIAISKDGKYLAAITEGSSYIKVWDLNTRQKIRDFLVGYDNTATGAEPSQITFSQVNTENLFFSGTFPSKISGYNGILNYNIAQNKIIDSTFAVGPLRVGQVPFCYFENEDRIITTRPNKILIINNVTKLWEFLIDKDTISGGQIFWGYNRYSNSLKYFIGFSQYAFSCIKNNLGTSVTTLQTKGTIYPNPATLEVSIKTDDTLIKGISIFNCKGVEVSTPSVLRTDTPQEGNLKIDVSYLPNGEYFIVLEGREKQTYKLIINK
jgi:WD40 repeat protein